MIKTLAALPEVLGSISNTVFWMTFRLYEAYCTLLLSQCSVTAAREQNCGLVGKKREFKLVGYEADAEKTAAIVREGDLFCTKTLGKMSSPSEGCNL